MTLTLPQQDRLIRLLRQRDRDKIPPILMPLWQPYRKKMIHGGRGSGKSESVVKIINRQSYNFRQRVLWTREIQKSIKRSIYDLIQIKIEEQGYPGWVFRDDHIFHKTSKSLYVFEGLKDIKAAQNKKSYARFDKAICDEAQTISEDNWRMLVPTIRKDGSEIWAIFNRYEELDPVYKLYCLKPKDNTLVIECNWRDNPWFPAVLEEERLDDMEDDYDLYLHIWENHPIAQLEKAIIDRILVDLAMKTTFPPDGPQVIGVDIARYGMDKSKAYERRGCKVKKIGEAKHTAPIEFAREIAHKADNQYVMINVDNGGLGAGGFIDKLKKELGFKNVNEINFGGTPKNKKKYANVATEMYFECKDKLFNADIPNDAILKQDLTGRLFGYDMKNRKKIEDKEKFRERYHRSPDDGDACVLCFYDPGKKLKLKGEEKRALQKLVKRNIIKNRSRFIV